MESSTLIPTTLDILKRTRELIADANNWTKGWFARTEQDAHANICAPEACKFCMLGAVNRAMHERGMYHYDGVVLGGTYVAAKAEETLRASLPERGMITNYNDKPETTHADVLACVDRAIAMLEAHNG